MIDTHSHNEDSTRPVLKQTLPALIGPPRARPSLNRYVLPSSFASHLIAAQQRMPNQRARRRAPINVAQIAYENGMAATVKRMPIGYRFATCA
jgi:hypothetical protein